jgi:ParB/RepB/Spo0J family partition protein
MDVRTIRLGDLIPTKDNPRHVSPKDPATVELAESLRELGQLQPVLARPHPKRAGKFDLRAGHRRLVAAKVAGLGELACVVRDMDDKEALEVTVTENLQREDLTPLEESRAVKSLMDGGWDVRSIAAHIGKGPEWVVRRARLDSLTKAWTDLLDEGKEPAMALSAAHLDVIARMEPEDQDDFLPEWRDYGAYDHWTLEDLEAHLANAYTQRLSSAPFKVDDVTLAPDAGACGSCTKRSSHRPGLFDDVDADEETIKKNDRCLGRECWSVKLEAYLERRVSELKGKHGAVLRAWDYYPGAGTSPEGAVSNYQINRCKKGDREAKLFVWINGAKACKTFWGKTWRSPHSTAAARSGPATLAERRAKLRKRRSALAIGWIRKVLENVEYFANEKCSGLVFQAPKDFPEIPEKALPMAAGVLIGMPMLAALAECFGVEGWTRNKYDAKTDSMAWDRCYGFKDPDVVAAQLWLRIRETLDQELAGDLNTYGDQKVRTVNAERVCSLVGMKFKAVTAAAKAKLPEPKSWAGLKADGTPKKKAKKKTKAKGRK